MLSNKTRGLNNIANSTALNNDSSELCLPSWILNAVNVQSVYISDTVITVVSIPFALFAVVANLAVLVIIIRSPSLHRPVNVMLCSLAASDCLTGLVLQPVYIAWRFLLHHFQDTCKLVHLYQASKSVPFMLIGCTFVNLSIMSVERLYAVSKPLAYSAKITLQGMVKIVISAWVIWFIYIILLETVVPEVLYQALESITMISMMIIPIGGHVLTFQAIRSNNKKILDATHNSQQAILFKREKKAFADMALYTVATLLSILPILLLLNVEKSIVSGHILFPWASVFSQLISSLNPVVQIKKNAALRQALKFAM